MTSSKTVNEQTAHLPEEIVEYVGLKPHPDNYQTHPPDQIEELQQSIRKHKIFRNVVISEDGYILAGHGMVEAAMGMGITHGPARRYPHTHDTLGALELLVADNETQRRADRDDRKLSGVLKRIYDAKGDAGLEGTGYDAERLAALVMVTRHKHEIRDEDEARHWVGMPDYDESSQAEHSRIVVHFPREEDREEFAAKLGVALTDKVSYMWYPPREKDDTINLRFEG